VCDAEVDALHSLVDKSLLRHSDDRYWMLETIREYAADKLEASCELEDVRRRHAEYYLAVAEEMFTDHAEARDRHAYEWAICDQDNVRVALRTFLRSDGERALRLARRLWKSWLTRGQLDEGEGWIESALAAEVDADVRLRAWMLGVRGEFARFRGEFQRAVEIKTTAIAQTRALGMDHDTKMLLCDLAECVAALGDAERAQEIVDDALELECRDDGPHSDTRARAAAADLAMQRGDHETARRWYEQILELTALTKNDITTSRVWAMSGYGECLRRIGDYDGAAKAFREALALARDSHVQTWLPDVLDGVAGLLAKPLPHKAAVLLGASEAIRGQTGLVPTDQTALEAITVSVRVNLAAVEFDTARAAGRAIPADDAIAVALREVPSGTETSVTNLPERA
jgi:tetratricopeptide (TPR) repeat protein